MAGKFKGCIRAAAICLACVSCGGPVERGSRLPLANTDRLPAPDITLEVPGLSNCTDASDRRLALKSDEPVIVIAHGCYSSAGRFRALADVFAFHGQQAVCFNYNDRDSLNRSADQLLNAVTSLSGHLKQANITVIGHSQGGLIARRALTVGHNTDVGDLPPRLRLVTISSPFGGIEAAAHCGSIGLAVASLGLTIPICQLVTGSKWSEIPPGSSFMRHPGRLAANVAGHLKIVTDERATCRRYDDRGRCEEDDYVFSLQEQYNPAVDRFLHLKNIEVSAGHVEIVGDARIVPDKLIGIFQDEGVLKKTPAALSARFALLLSRLYHDQRPSDSGAGR